MRISNTRLDALRPDPATGAGATGSTESAQKPEAHAAPRGDTVQISAAGRALAARQTESAGAVGGELSPERITEIRQRILSGAYDSLEVVQEVARRMLERGDI